MSPIHIRPALFTCVGVDTMDLANMLIKRACPLDIKRKVGLKKKEKTFSLQPMKGHSGSVFCKECCFDANCLCREVNESGKPIGFSH